MPCYEPRDRPNWYRDRTEELERELVKEKQKPVGMMLSQSYAKPVETKETCIECCSLDKKELDSRHLTQWYVNHLVDDVVFNSDFVNTNGDGLICEGRIWEIDDFSGAAFQCDFSWWA